jgi:hypothetical protein
VLDWLQLRAGYRADMRSNDENVATAGFGLSPFNNAYPHDNRHVTVTSRAPDIPHRPPHTGCFPAF